MRPATASPFAAILLLVASCSSQSGTIVGELRAQGGRYPGLDVLTTGPVTVWSGESRVADVTVDGLFEIQLPAGTYRVDATFANNLGCDDQTVTVTSGKSVHVIVSCPMSDNNAMRNVLKQDLSFHDRLVAQSLLDDLQRAMRGQP
ncbi:MAG: hypothetical protein WEE36_02895 [Acidimicrobiia bacterium]